MPWARTIGNLPFDPEKWGDRVIRIAAPGGTSIVVRRHGLPHLSLWLPAKLMPTRGAPFGLYLHADSQFADRADAAALFRRAIGMGVPIRPKPYVQAHRQAAMLLLHDHAQRGAPLRDIAALLLDPLPDDWRSSSERSDLRRLLDTACEMVAGGYRGLLGSRRTS